MSRAVEKFSLLRILQSRLFSDEFRNAHRRCDRDFIRRSPLSFQNVFCVIGRMMLKSIQRELDEFFGVLFDARGPVRAVSAAAFCKARRKLRYTAFVELSDIAVEHTYATNGRVERPAGYRLLAIDGTKLRLPESAEIRAHFGPPTRGPGREGPPLALASQCWDILNGIILDARLLPGDASERDAALLHLPRLGENDLLLLDRGYAGYETFQAILERDADFCCRVPVGFSKSVKAFVESGRKYGPVEFKPGRGPSVKSDALVLWGVRIDRPAKEPVVLITSLNPKHFGSDFFGELYRLRWEIEEGYKHLKNAAQIENFSGKSVETVRQDFYARVLIVNLTAILALPLHQEVKRRTSGRKYEYDINWTSALSKVRAYGVFLFLGEDIEKLIHDLQEAFIQNLSPKRPNRRYPRRKRVQRARFAMNYKSI